MLGKIDGRRRRGWQKTRLVGWRHWLDGLEFEQPLGHGEGQGNLAMGSQSRTQLRDWTTTKPLPIKCFISVTLFWWTEGDRCDTIYDYIWYYIWPLNSGDEKDTASVASPSLSICLFILILSVLLSLAVYSLWERSVSMSWDTQDVLWRGSQGRKRKALAYSSHQSASYVSVS